MNTRNAFKRSGHGQVECEPPRVESIDVVFGAPEVTSLAVFRMLRSVFEGLALDLNALTVQRWGETLEALERELKQNRHRSFTLTQAETSLSHWAADEVFPANMNVSCAAGWYEKMLPAVLSHVAQLPGFVMAYGMNLEYWGEQNEEDAKQRKRLGYRCDEARVSCDGGPFPVTQFRYDISRNAGRLIRHPKYVEIPAAEMWLGEPFWEATGASQQAVVRAAWWRKNKINDQVVQIRAWPQLFTSDQEEQGLVQKKLRALLFPNDANEEEKALLGSSAPGAR